jgi:hypothetical protein
MKLKKYGKGGKYEMYGNGGGVKVTKKMADDKFKKDFEAAANMTNDLAKQLAKGVDAKGMPLKPAAKNALAEQIKKRKASEQGMKANYRYVGTEIPAGEAPFEDDAMYEKGGKIVGPKKKDKVTKITPEYIKQQEGFAKATYESYMDGLKKMGKDVNARTKYEGELKAIKSMYADLDYASLSDKDKAAVDKHKKEAMKFAFSSVPAYLKGGQVKLKKKK